MSLALKTIPLGFGYAIWSGVGTALTAVVGYFIFKEKIDKKIFFGIVLIIIGLVLMRI